MGDDHVRALPFISNARSASSPLDPFPPRIPPQPLSQPSHSHTVPAFMQAYQNQPSAHYGSPTHQQAPIPPHPVQQPAQVPTPRKRKKPRAGDSAEGDASEDDGQSKKDKRAKTPRACDSCRRKKIRCDLIEEDPPLCKHCKAHNFGCTWFLPITETRWKKTGKPSTNSQRAASLSNASDQGPSLEQTALRQESPPQFNIPTDILPFPSGSTSALTRSNTFPPVPSLSPLPNSAPPYQNQFVLPPPQTSTAPAVRSMSINRQDPRMLGPTSISYLVNSMSTLPPERVGFPHLKHPQTWDVKETADGFIKLFRTTAFQSMRTGPESTNYASDPLAPTATQISASTIEQLVNTYFNRQGPLYPIMSRADFLTSTPLEPILLWTICGVAAMTVRVPPNVFRAIKINVALCCREIDILAASTLQSVQALLMYAFSLHLERGTPGTKCWNALGAAVRQAQDIGLHRESDTTIEKQTDPHHVEMRRRIWSGCIIADRWVSAIYGLPMMIDIADCDRLYPSVFEYLPGQTSEQVNTSTKPFLGNASLVELSIHLGEVLKLLYTPSGIHGVKDEQLISLAHVLDTWLAELPEELHFDDPTSCSLMSGFLHMAYLPVRFLFSRPFLKMTYTADNIAFYITFAQWCEMAARGRSVIAWLDLNDHVYEGWSIAMYSGFICALIQYHHYVRTGEEEALTSLRQAKDLTKRLSSDEMPGRCKVAEIVAILEHTAASFSSTNDSMPTESAGGRMLQPTSGVNARFSKDAHRFSDLEYAKILKNDARVRSKAAEAEARQQADAGNAQDNKPADDAMQYSTSSQQPFTFLSVDAGDPNAMFTFAPNTDLPANANFAFDSLPNFGDPNSWLQNMGAPPML